MFESEENYISKWVFLFLVLLHLVSMHKNVNIYMNTIKKFPCKHVRDGSTLIEFDFFPYQVLKLFGDYVHGVSLDLKLVEYLQLFEFAHFIQCTSLVDDCTAEISFLIGISKELAGI